MIVVKVIPLNINGVQSASVKALRSVKLMIRNEVQNLKVSILCLKKYYVAIAILSCVSLCM